MNKATAHFLSAHVNRAAADAVTRASHAADDAFAEYEVSKRQAASSEEVAPAVQLIVEKAAELARRR